jgi:hypothetical protein
MRERAREDARREALASQAPIAGRGLRGLLAVALVSLAGRLDNRVRATDLAQPALAR